jgi:hypothetical protein
MSSSRLLAAIVLGTWGCGGSVIPAPGGSETAPAAKDAGPDAPGCTVIAQQFDQSCATDTDCTLVYTGGNFCTPGHPVCGDPWEFFCIGSPINVHAKESYTAALSAAVGGQSISNFLASCADGGLPYFSCFEPGTPTCVNGTCNAIAPP